MPTYKVTLTCTNATVATTYRIEATSADEAIEKAKTGEYRCIDEEVIPDSDTDAEATLVDSPRPDAEER